MKNVLYVIDDINYDSGAQKATIYQIMILSMKYQIDILCLRKPNEEIFRKLSMVKFIGQEIWEHTELFTLSCKEVLNSNYLLRQKILRIKHALYMRLNSESDLIQKYIDNKLRKQLNQYDIVIVVSESSKLRKLVSELEHPKKIQWIHTDYAAWSEFSDWTKNTTVNDKDIYQKYDIIVTLSERTKLGFIQKLPMLKDKLNVIPNLINVEEILKKSLEPLEFTLNKNFTNVITVGRLDKEKAFDRVIDISKKIKQDGILFRWYIIGDGPLKKQLQYRIKQESLTNEVIMLGKLENPYPMMKCCDLFALLSEYEGQPVTIQEALLLCTPVIATNVGGVQELFHNSHEGILVDNNEQEIYTKLKFLLEEKNINKIKIDKYIYNENIILNKLYELFDRN